MLMHPARQKEILRATPCSADLESAAVSMKEAMPCVMRGFCKRIESLRKQYVNRMPPFVSSVLLKIARGGARST